MKQSDPYGKSGTLEEVQAKVKNGTDKTTGKYKGRRLAEEVSLSHSGGYVLVGVAGMEYAAAVEAKGYEVVSGANTQCEKYLRDTLKSVFSKI